LTTVLSLQLKKKMIKEQNPFVRKYLEDKFLKKVDWCVVDMGDGMVHYRLEGESQQRRMWWFNSN
jgi:hypothetical protein